MSAGPGDTGSFTGDGAEPATAFVAGAAALAVAAHPDLTPSQLSGRLTTTAYYIPADKALVGAGTVDPAAAVTAPDPSAAPSPQAPAALRMEPPRPIPAAPRPSPSPPPPGPAAGRYGAVGGTPPDSGRGVGLFVARLRPVLPRQTAGVSAMR
ncbi:MULTISPECIES: S8 family serine peptidase [unclassified Streptomyces]|uniref:S8 family serine peptidase n=1 Tax=unclassified Streptomyces TaxID=2593676 RepID=UPI00380F1B18